MIRLGGCAAARMEASNLPAGRLAASRRSGGEHRGPAPGAEPGVLGLEIPAGSATDPDLRLSRGPQRDRVADDRHLLESVLHLGSPRASPRFGIPGLPLGRENNSGTREPLTPHGAKALPRQDEKEAHERQRKVPERQAGSARARGETVAEGEDGEEGNEEQDEARQRQRRALGGARGPGATRRAPAIRTVDQTPLKAAFPSCRFRFAITSRGICLGHTAAHSPMLEQEPKPSSSIWLSMATTRL